MSLQKMFIIPPEIFEKWKHMTMMDKRLSDLDRQMKSVLYNNKLPDMEKWHLYRQNLQKHIHSAKQIGKFVNLKNEHLKHLESVGVQTKPIYKRHKNEQTEAVMNKDFSTQTRMEEDDIISNTSNNSEGLENIFETSNMYSSIGDSDMDLSAIPEDVDARDIVRERTSKDASLRILEMKNGDVITMPISDKKKSKKRKVLKTPEKGSKQSTLNFNSRKSARIAAASTMKKVKKHSSPLKWSKYN